MRTAASCAPGLRALASTGKPGLRALMRVARVDPSGLDARSVGFRLAPRINAAGRLHRADAGVELVLTEDEARADAIAEELDAANAERRFTEQRILFEAEAQVRELGPRPAYVLAGEGWHPGVIGIVASRIVERTHRPAILLALDPAAGVGTGSGRSIPAFDLLGALHAAAPLLERYGGHRAAAGLTIDAARVDELREAFEAHAAATLAAEDLQPVERVDAVVGGAQLGLALADELAQLEPTGMGNPGVNLLVPAASLVDARTMGEEGRHVRFTVEAGGGRCRAVSFGCDGRLPVGPTSPRTRPSGSSATAGTGRSSRGCDCAMPQPRRPSRSNRRRAAPATPGWPPSSARAPSAPEAASASRAHARSTGAETGRWPSCATSCGSGERRARRRGRRAAPHRRPQRPHGRVLAVLARARSRARRGSSTPTVHIVVLDPPAHADEDALLRRGDAGTFAHLCWGAAELRFAEQIHESEHGLRAALVPLYRALRDRGGAAGEELEALLRGDGPHARSVAQAARLVAILTELDLVSLDRETPALTVRDAERTALDGSATYRATMQRYEDGRRWLEATGTATGQLQTRA